MTRGGLKPTLPVAHCIAVLCLMLLARPAQAQDIGQQIDRIGASSDLEFDLGTRSITQVFRGPSGGAWVVDVVEGRDPNGPRLSRDYRDARGQLLRVDYATGLSSRFTPHNCQRTIGACLFIQTGPDGESQQGRLTAVTPEGLQYQTSVINRPGGDPIPVERGDITLDAMGSSTGSQITAQDGSVMQVRLVQAVYR